MSGGKRTTFKAYNPRGELVISVWTSSPGIEAVERGAFQSRLDKGELASVDVAYDEPTRRNETLLPRISNSVFREPRGG